MILFGIILAADKNIIDETNSFLLNLGVRPILAGLAREMERSKVRQWSIVLGYDFDVHRRVIENVSIRPVTDPEWQNGFASQVRTGLHEMPPQADGFIILPGNLPFFGKTEMNLLVDALEAEKGYIIIPSSNGKIFPFPLFHRKLLGEVLNRIDEGTLKSIINEHVADTYEIEMKNPHKLLQVVDRASYLKAKDIAFKSEQKEEQANPQMEIPE